MDKPRNIDARTHFWSYTPNHRYSCSLGYLHTANPKAVTCLKCLKALLKSYPTSSVAKAEMAMRLGMEYANRIRKKQRLTKTQRFVSINSTLNSGGSHGS